MKRLRSWEPSGRCRTRQFTSATVSNIKNVTAATLVSVFNGTSNMAALLGAYLSDTHLGGFKTLGFASVSSLLVRTLNSVYLICSYSLNMKIQTLDYELSQSP